MSGKENPLGISNKEYYELLKLGKKVTRSTKAIGDKIGGKSSDLKERGEKTHNESDSEKSEDNSKSKIKKSVGKIKKRDEKKSEDFQERFSKEKTHPLKPVKKSEKPQTDSKPKLTKQPKDVEIKDVEMKDSSEKEVDAPKIEKKSTKEPKVVKKQDEESKSVSKSAIGKRNSESKPKSSTDKRKKTEKGEVSVSGADKRKIRHIEWHYGRHCSRDLWIGKKVKVKIQNPAKTKDDSPEYRFGKLIDIKEDSDGELNLLQIEWSQNHNKSKEWINLKENRVYIFGQMLFLKYHSNNDQIEQIKNTYKWKSKNKKAVPMPVIELIDANDESKMIKPYEDASEKIPIQYFNLDKAKKIRQEVLYDYREFKDDDLEFMKENFKNGDKLHSKVLSYKKYYGQWMEKYGKIPVDISKSLKEFTCKILRIYKGDRNCGKVVVLRVLNEEGRNEIALIRYLKNSKLEWIDVLDNSEDDKDSKITLKYDQIKGVITYDSLRNCIAPKGRAVLPFEYTDSDSKLDEWTEEKWRVGFEC